MKTYPPTLIKNAIIIIDGKKFHGNVLIENGLIADLSEGNVEAPAHATVIDAQQKYLLPGVIDDQVHFRDPGLTHKGDIYSESRAAVAGGVTSFMDMPNTIPNTLTQELLEDKYRNAAENSLANYSFYMGVSNDNLEEVLKTDFSKVCGVKMFLGASTGNMLVDNLQTIEDLFTRCNGLIAVHCEDEPTIRENLKYYQSQYGDEIPASVHPLIRSREACYKSSSFAINLARKHNTRLHVLHLSTADEMELFDAIPFSESKRITAEACVHHLWFSEEDYERLNTMIKWNPAIKSADDRAALLKALVDDRIDVVATDHAPHTKDEKARSYMSCPSGGPLVQHSLVAMLELVHKGKISLDLVVDKMCHSPARVFNIKDRGFIRKGYHADLTLVDMNSPWVVSDENILYKCSWSPFVGVEFHSRITHTFVGGHLAWENGVFHEEVKGQRLLFNN